MTKFLKVNGHESLVRDTDTNAIINNNEKEYQQYIKQRELHLQRKKVMEEQQKDIHNLRDELSELKQQFAELMNIRKKEI